MRIGLVSYRCENRNIPFNLSQIEKALRETEGKVDLLCFGEAFLQGFDSLCWDYETDKDMAVSTDSETIRRLCSLTLQYGTGLLVGYIERDRDRLYSSCIVLADGEIAHNYRRISKGWKEFSITDRHYCEGGDPHEFCLFGETLMLALCGDLWDYPEKFRTDHLLIWPVYVNYSTADWEGGILEEYASQAALAASDTLMINPIDHNPENHGGSFHFRLGKLADRIPFDEEQILIIRTDHLSGERHSS